MLGATALTVRSSGPAAACGRLRGVAPDRASRAALRGRRCGRTRVLPRGADLPLVRVDRHGGGPLHRRVQDHRGARSPFRRSSSRRSCPSSVAPPATTSTGSAMGCSACSTSRSCSGTFAVLLMLILAPARSAHRRWTGVRGTRRPSSASRASPSRRPSSSSSGSSACSPGEEFGAADRKQPGNRRLHRNDAHPRALARGEWRRSGHGPAEVTLAATLAIALSRVDPQAHAVVRQPPAHRPGVSRSRRPCAGHAAVGDPEAAICAVVYLGVAAVFRAIPPELVSALLRRDSTGDA